MLFCNALSVDAVSLIFASGTGRVNAHSIIGVIEVGRGCGAGLITGINCGPEPTPDKFAAVIPDPCKAATTLSRLVLILD